MATFQLENLLVDIISKEMFIENIENNIKELGFLDERIEIQLKAFFLKAKEDDVIEFASYLYDKVFDINSYVLEVIVSNLKEHKLLEVENLFVEIYMNSSTCNEKTSNCINNYLQQTVN